MNNERTRGDAVTDLIIRKDSCYPAEKNKETLILYNVSVKF